MSNIFIEHLGKNRAQLKKIKEYFKLCSQEINNSNLFMLRKTCMYISFVYVIMFTLALFVLPEFKHSLRFYLPLPIVLTVFFFINLYTRKKDNISSRSTMIICSTYYFAVFICILIMDVIAFPNTESLWFPFFLIAFPMLFIDRIYKTSLYETIFLVVYMVVARIYEPESIFRIDSYRALAAYVLSLLLGRIIIDMRCDEGLAKIKLTELSSFDMLTHTYNKTTFYQKVSELIKNNTSKKSCALCVIDVDDFKYVNDNLGHDTGDKLLTHIGSLLNSTVVNGDIVGRYGGDEFVLFIPDAGSSDLIAFKLRNLQMFLTDFSVDGSSNFTVSIGAVFDCFGSDITKLFKVADDALYTSKLSGKNMCTVWSVHIPAEHKKPVLMHLSHTDNAITSVVNSTCTDDYDIYDLESADALSYLSQLYGLIGLIIMDFDSNNSHDTLFMRYLRSRDRFADVKAIAVAADEPSAALAARFGMTAINKTNLNGNELKKLISSQNQRQH